MSYDASRLPAFGGSALVGVLLSGWLVGALAVGNAGLLRSAPQPVVTATAVSLVGALVLLFVAIAPLRRWALAVDLRTLVLLHISRLVGIYFLILYRHEKLPWAFAVPGGWGDIAVAVGALGVAVCASADRPAGRRVYWWWNLAGLIDLLAVVATATRLGVQMPASMLALRSMPLVLLPTYLVPILLASHLLIFWRLREARRPNGPARSQA